MCNVDEKELENIVGGDLKSGNDVEVPNLIGMSFEDAKNKLSSKGLSCDYKYMRSDKQVDFVILSDPLPGTKVNYRSVVMLTLSSGE